MTFLEMLIQNYFVVKGFAYTNLLSAQLLDACSIIVVVVLSFLFLKVRYHWTQILGILVCLGGLGLLVASDSITYTPYKPQLTISGKNYGSVDAVKGDLFVILGSCCYGLSNVLEEFLVSKRPLYEVVGQVASRLAYLIIARLLWNVYYGHTMCHL
jgi:solute carrier family 35, member F1/2